MTAAKKSDFLLIVIFHTFQIKVREKLKRQTQKKRDKQTFGDDFCDKE